MRKFCFLHCVLFSVRSLHPLQLLLLSEAFCNSLKKTWFQLMRACVCANFVRMCGYHPMLFLQCVFFWDSLPEAAMMRFQQDMPRLLAVAQDEEQRGKEGTRQILEPAPMILFTLKKRLIWNETANSLLTVLILFLNVCYSVLPRNE